MSIPKCVLDTMSKEDQATYHWAQEKKAALRKSKRGRENVRKSTEEILVRAAKNVVRDWPTCRLSTAVRELEMAVSAYEEVRK
jgi:Ser/Thr protein kinase RdoA (MazF antagonist)